MANSEPMGGSPISPTKFDPPAKVLLPFDLSEVDLSRLDELDAESLKAAIRAVKRSPLEATSAGHNSFGNTSPGTNQWSSHNSYYGSGDDSQSNG